MSNLIQPFILKKTFVFYWSLAKMYLKDSNDAELSDFGLGNATEKEVFIVQIKEDSEDHFIKEAEIRIVMGMAEKLNKITAAATAPKKSADKAA